MASGFTNRGKYQVIGFWMRGATIPTNFYVALATDAATPDADTNTFGQLTEITAGNGYTTGGYQITLDATGVDVWSEDDTNDRALFQLADVVWTATGGPIPSADSDARWAVLLDDDGTVANREVYIYWDLVSNRSVSDGQSLTLQDCEGRLTE